MREEEEDQINLLPDCVICEILSHVEYKKEALEQVHSPNDGNAFGHHIRISFLYFFHLRSSDFFSFIEKILTQCRRMKLKKSN